MMNSVFSNFRDPSEFDDFYEDPRDVEDEEAEAREDLEDKEFWSHRCTDCGCTGNICICGGLDD